MLRRCGGSSNKPYCDRTHLTNGFVGTEVADRGTTETRRDVYRGDGIGIHDDRPICAHIGNCTDNLASVFKLGVEPWIDATAERGRGDRSHHRPVPLRSALAHAARFLGTGGG